MNYIKNFIKPLIFILGIIIIGLLVITPLNYFDVINGNITNIIKIIIPIISLFIGGFMIGKISNKKGWLEGLKLGIVTILIFILISYIGFNESFKLKSLIYYIILAMSSIFGSIIGINKKIDK